MVGDILQPTHLLFILVVALLVLGPKRLPEVGRTLGGGLRDFRAAINGEATESHRSETHHVQSTIAAEPTPDAGEATPPIQFTEPPSADAAAVVEPDDSAPQSAPAVDLQPPTHEVSDFTVEPVATVDEQAVATVVERPVATLDEQPDAEREPARAAAAAPLFAQALQGERATRAAAEQPAELVD